MDIFIITYLNNSDFNYIYYITKFKNNNVIFIFCILRLRWYILGKHSTSVFTTNRNTEESANENSLLSLSDIVKEDECILTAAVIENSRVFGTDNNYTNYITIDDQSTKLLNSFELEVRMLKTIKYLKNTSYFIYLVFS